MLAALHRLSWSSLAISSASVSHLGFDRSSATVHLLILHQSKLTEMSRTGKRNHDYLSDGRNLLLDRAQDRRDLLRIIFPLVFVIS